jgi:fibronectin type 3 domain-containing protein
VPDAPTLNSVVPGNAQVVLGWSAPASNGGGPITGYTATASPGGSSCATTTLGCTISNLTNGVSYTFVVVASNAIGPSPASNQLSATPATVPGAPSLAPATAGNGTVSLSWTAPASNGGSALIGYKLYRRTTPNDEILLTTLGTVTTFSDSTVANGTTYIYSVSAVNGVGEGARSSERSATPSAPATVPGAPTGLVATPGNSQVTLNWTAPSNGGSAITGYRIYRGTASGNKTHLATVANATTFTDTGGKPGTTYYYQVTALNAVGESARSNEASAKSFTLADGPRNLTATTHTTLGVVVAWGIPSSDGGSPITGYRIYRSTSAGTETFLAAVGTVTSYQDTSTVSGTRYYYRAAAVTAAGTGALSREANAVAR